MFLKGTSSQQQCHHKTTVLNIQSFLQFRHLAAPMEHYFVLKNELLRFLQALSRRKKNLISPMLVQVFDIVNGTGKILKDAPLCIRHLGSR
jgi:hypothetical protein